MDHNDPHKYGASDCTSGASFYLVSQGHLSVTSPETPSYSSSTNRNSVLWDFLGVCSNNPPLRPPPVNFRSSFTAPTNFLTLNSGGAEAQLHHIPSNPRPPIAPTVPPSPVGDNPTGLLSSSRPPTKGCRRIDGATAEYRHQRKLRNRGAAERSRARRNAYDMELKVKIAMLREEYEELKRKEEELRLALEETRPLNLRRSFSAPV
ncbi:bZIP transcription factor 27-like [Mangifera indica]|uniref:bZIP transcription factor 27-like n=1 Tax=Mangifera indica TaxID=29780 RepID=UPI001CFAD5FF|nr:bZIP transcription factor 27-like [Mangifera indica]